MKRIVFFAIAVVAIASSHLANANHSYLKAAIQQNDLQTVKEELKRMGPIHHKEKEELLDEARILIMRTRKLHMSLWDWTKFLTGTSTMWVSLINGAAIAGISKGIDLTARQREAGIKLGGLLALGGGLTGLGMMISGYRCNGMRKLWYSALDIQKAIEKAPVHH